MIVAKVDGRVVLRAERKIEVNFDPGCSYSDYTQDPPELVLTDPDNKHGRYYVYDFVGSARIDIEEE